ncbi:hypothetical protein QR77_41450 [Streptomyces sp. 150FB]|nr:hypothetical protein QR77_41450 [Streptomyces sp. 150FB]
MPSRLTKRMGLPSFLRGMLIRPGARGGEQATTFEMGAPERRSQWPVVDLSGSPVGQGAGGP